MNTKEQKPDNIELNKIIINDIKFFKSIAKKKGYRPKWVVLKTYEKYKDLILKKKILSGLASTIHLSKANIVSYVKLLKETGIKNQYTDEVDEIEGIERKVKKPMTADERAAFLLDQRNKHKTGYINE